VLLDQVLKNICYRMMRTRIGRARSFGSYQILKPGGGETALRHEKNWLEKESWEDNLFWGLPKALGACSAGLQAHKQK